MLYYNFLPTTFATYLNEIFYLLQRFGIFFLFEKENACKRKAKQGEIPLYPRERRAAVHSLLFSVGSSAHSPVNSLRSNSTGSCGLQSKPFPRSSQLGCTTAARLLEACSSRFIKSLALPFLLFFFHNFRFAVPYTQKSYPRDFPRVGSLFYYAYKLTGVILKVGRSLGDLLHGDLFFSELTLILILIVVLGLAVEGAVGGKGYYRAAAL